MFKMVLAFVTGLSFLLSAYATPYLDGPADLVVKNAKIVTIDKDRPRAEAVAVRGEMILKVGKKL